MSVIFVSLHQSSLNLFRHTYSIFFHFRSEFIIIITVFIRYLLLLLSRNVNYCLLFFCFLCFRFVFLGFLINGTMRTSRNNGKCEHGVQTSLLFVRGTRRSLYGASTASVTRGFSQWQSASFWWDLTLVFLSINFPAFFIVSEVSFNWNEIKIKINEEIKIKIFIFSNNILENDVFRKICLKLFEILFEIE